MSSKLLYKSHNQVTVQAPRNQLIISFNASKNFETTHPYQKTSSSQAHTNLTKAQANRSFIYLWHLVLLMGWLVKSINQYNVNLINYQLTHNEISIVLNIIRNLAKFMKIIKFYLKIRQCIINKYKFLQFELLVYGRNITSKMYQHNIARNNIAGNKFAIQYYRSIFI